MRIKKSVTAPLLALVVMTLAGAVSLVDISSLQDGAGENIYLSVIILQIIIFTLPGIFYAKLRGTGYALKLNVRLIPLSRIGFSVLALLVMITGSAVWAILTHRLGVYTEYTASYFYRNYLSAGSLNTLSDALYVVTAFALIPAVTEEFLFRGILLTEYTEDPVTGGKKDDGSEGETGTNGPVCASVMSSLLYAMLHFSAENFLLFFFFGILLCTVVYVTKSLIAAMLVHTLFEIYGIFAESYVINVITGPENGLLAGFVMTTLLLLALAFLFGEGERLYHNDGVNGMAVPAYAAPEGTWLRNIGLCIISPSFLLCAGAFLAGLILL